MGFRNLKCRNGAQNRNLREKLSKTGHVEKFWLWSKSTVKVNGQSQRSESTVNWWRVLTWQEEKRSRRVWRVSAWRVPTACGGVCDAVFSRSWLGFAQDWLFYLSMPFLWQLNAQNVDIRVLQVLWAWRRWLASDSDDWMKMRVAEERRRCPQEPKSQRNGSDTMLTI